LNSDLPVISCDARKWLKVPCDCGVAICAHPEEHHRVMAVDAEYLIEPEAGRRDGIDWTPEFSRRARGTAVYAALRQLGRRGLADFVDRCCAHAQRFVEGLLTMQGAEVLHERALNQVLVAFGDHRHTAAVVDHLQSSGTCWMSGTTWRGRAAIRISVVGHRTTADDVDLTLAAITDALAATA
jgi:glutamate/tyrosine decarboxylase-like PLP-dependent enzyme